MTRPTTTLLATALAVLLGACTQKAPEPTPEPTAPEAAVTAPEAEPLVHDAVPELTAECNADAVQGLIGQEATDAVLEQAKADSGATLLRALKPNQPATMDFRIERLDIALDENGVIQSLRCG